MLRYPLSELAELVGSGLAHEELTDALVIVEDDGAVLDPIELRGLPAVLAAHQPLDVADVELVGSVDELAETIERAPLASTALAILLRATLERTIEDGLVAESAVYSMLQGGPEFAAWRRAYPARQRIAEIGPAVSVERDGDRLTLTLSRPHVHNAFSRRVRDDLADALSFAHTDDSIRVVELRGVGPSFCSGGDLNEFGSFPDPVSAHLIRLTRSPARLMAAVGDRVEVHLHGACMGAGIELPAFAKRIIAAEDSVMSLPEIGLGLVPGAGGTVSIPRRIGRHRAAWLALTGKTIDAATALDWGLVDEIQ